MKIYTGTGDRGKTSLFSGQRVSKADERIEAYGDLDELNSTIGGLVAGLPGELAELIEELRQIQSALFQIGALFATTPDSPSWEALPPIASEQIEKLEQAMDRMAGSLPELKRFVLPGGHVTAAWSHLARAICRRAERHAVRFLDTAFENRIPEPYRKALVYINRLSDYLFLVARYCNHILGVPEELWKF